MGVTNLGQSLKGFLASGFGKIGIESRHCLAQVALQDGILQAIAAQAAGEAEGFVVPGLSAFPTELVAEVISEGLLNETVFAVDVGDHGRLLSSFPLSVHVTLFRDLGVSAEISTEIST
jgi:hypothetical protein